MDACLHAQPLAATPRCGAAASARRAAVTRLQPARRQPHRVAVVPHAAAGKKAAGAPSPAPKPKGFGSAAPAPTPAAADAKPANGYWTKLDVTLTDLEAKPRTPVILANGTALMLWLLDGKVYASAANGTAYQYPLVDAEVVTPPPAGAAGPVVRSALDGTSYELATGRVLEWCPKEDAPLSFRNLLAGLKQAATPVDLPVYKTRVAASGAVEVLITVKA